MAGVLITGASTGIGEASARLLAAEGFTVFAGVRSDEDAARLEGDGVVPLRLDVTDAAQISAAVGAVEQQLAGRPLAGIVNNAGIAVPGPFELLAVDDLRRQLEVNSIAPVAVTQAFLPLLRPAKGRVVNMSSIGGLVAQPFVGAYSMSKFALEAMTDSLRRELLPWGIRVIAIEPGTIRTPMWEKGIHTGEQEIAALDDTARALYGRRMERVLRTTAKLAARGVPADDVAKAVHHALTARRPRLRYRVGDAKLFAVVGGVVPDRVLDQVLGRLM